MASSLFDLTGKTAVVTGGNGGIGLRNAPKIYLKPSGISLKI